MLIKFCSLVSPKVRHTFFVKLRQVRPHDRVSDGKIWSFVMLILQMITNFRFKRFYVVAPCGIETSWGALFLSPQWHLHYSKASSFPCIHSTTNPSLSRSYVLNISKKNETVSRHFLMLRVPIHSVYGHAEWGSDMQSFSRLMSKPSLIMDKVYPFSPDAWGPLYNN